MSFADNPNPYQSPTPGFGTLSQDVAGIAKGKTMPAGIALLVVGILSLIIMGFWSLSTIVAISVSDSPEFQPPPNATPEERTGFFVGFYGTMIGMTLSAICQIAVIVGGISLLTLKSRTMAVIGCVFTFLPCTAPCCLLAFPFGIWGLVVLADPNVKLAMARR